MIRRAIPLLHVTDSQKALRFYCHGLGFQLEFEHRPEGVTGDPCYMGVSRDGVWLHLSSFSGDGVAWRTLWWTTSIDSMWSSRPNMFISIRRRSIKAGAAGRCM